MTYADGLLTTSPLGYWPCDDGSGTTLNDASGNGLHLPLAGFADFGSWVADPGLGSTVVAGNFLNYSTTDPCAWQISGSTIDPGEPWTVSGWVRHHPGSYDEDAPASFPDGLFEMRVNVWTGSFTVIPLAATADAGDQSDLSSVSAENSNATASAADYARPWLDSWVHVYAEHDGTTVTVFVDGVQAATATAAAPGSLGSAFLTVELVGRMAHLAVWDRVLTPTEKALVGTFPGPPPPPSTATWDDFDRADGALGTADPVALAWSTPVGTWAIASNKAEPTGMAGPSTAALAVLPATAAGLPAPEAVSVTITTPGAGSWFGGALQGATGVSFTGVGVVAGDDGSLSAIRWAGDGSVVGIDSTTVDVSAGDHDLVFSIDLDDGTHTLRAWWDGTLYLETEVPAGYLSGGYGDVALLAYDTDADDLAFDDVAVKLPAMALPTVPGPSAWPGGLRNNPIPPDVIFAPSVPAPALRGGLMAWPTRPTEPIYAPSVAAPPLLGGLHHTWSDTPNPPPLPGPGEDPWPPGYQYGSPTDRLEVAGYPLLTDARCRPQLNGPGSGSFTVVPPGPSEGDAVTYTSGGAAVFRGVVNEVTEVVAAAGEEAAQLVTASTPSKLSVDWSRTVVYPDFGAGDPIRVGQPAQDDRVWGWPMNGLIVPGLNWTTSVGGDNGRYGTPEEIFPLPDNWPDNRAQWMWTTEVDVESQPEGWCYFRMPFGVFAGTYSLFVCAWDYARVWIDGVLVATVEQGGTTQRVDLDFDWDFHLIAIEAYARGGGPAGVLVSLLQRHAHAFGGTDCYSRGGWKALERPTVSMRATVGKVLRRLVDEAAARGAPAGGWSCSFSDEADSAGTSWPAGENAPLLTTKVGSTMWDVLNQFGESLIDFYPAAGSDTLHAFVKDTAGSSLAIPWTHTVDADSISERTAI